MVNNNFLEACKRRFPGHVVGGSGRWALYTPAAGPMAKILLFENRDEAAAQILDPKQVQIVDLSVDLDSLLAKMPDRHYERERRA
jgi:hypothetical protein